MKKFIAAVSLFSAFAAQNALALDYRNAIQYANFNSLSSDRWASQAVIRTDRYVRIRQQGVVYKGQVLGEAPSLILESYDRGKIDPKETQVIGNSLAISRSGESKTRILNLTVFGRSTHSNARICIPKGSTKMYLILVAEGMDGRSPKNVYRAQEGVLQFDADQPGGSDDVLVSLSSTQLDPDSAVDQETEQACSRAVAADMSLLK